MDESSISIIKKYANSGRDAVNIVQMAAGVASSERRDSIETRDVEWVINSGQYSPRPDKKINSEAQVGLVHGLAVYGPNMGILLEIETTAIKTGGGQGKISVTGIVEEEEMGGGSHRIRRKGAARGSVDNVMTVLRKYLGVDPRDFDLHLNFPGGVPIDGPSAGISIAVSIYSAMMNIPIRNDIAMTGELSVRGFIKPVGGVVPKIEAARRAGASTVIIPQDNWQDMFETLDMKVLAVDRIEDVMKESLLYSNYDGRTTVFAARGTQAVF